MSRKVSKTTAEEQIKAEIRRMQKRNSSDWQGLARQVNRHYKVLSYNRPQAYLMYLMAQFNVIFNVWCRATGKTTAMGGVIKNVWYDMPQSLNVIETSSYHKFFSEIIPSLRSGLEKHGLYEGLHYFIGRKPPKNWGWNLPHQYPHVDDNCIFSFTGAAHVLVSQDAKGGGLGLNTDSIIRDEAKLLNIEKSLQQVNGTKRGSNVKALKDCKYFMSEVFFSSAPTTQKESWMLDFCDNLDKSNGTGISLWAQTKENAANLAPNFLEEQRKTFLFQWLYDAEFYNILPKKVMDAFYNLFTEDKHGYINRDYSHFNGFQEAYEESCLFDGDLDPHKELILGVDYGGRGNFGIVCQVNEGQYMEFRALKDFFVLHEDRQTQRDLAKKIATYYRHHKTKVIRIIGDTQGFHALGTDTRTRADMFKEDMEAEGWQVSIEQIGMVNPPHHLRRTLWEMMMREDDWYMPRFRINLENCRNTVIAMQRTQTLENRKGELTKDKSSEKSTSGVRTEHATHPTDAIDYPVWYLFSALLESKGIALPHATSTTRS
jgi:hypothetical protein